MGGSGRSQEVRVDRHLRGEVDARRSRRSVKLVRAQGDAREARDPMPSSCRDSVPQVSLGEWARAPVAKDRTALAWLGWLQNGEVRFRDPRHQMAWARLD